MGSANKLDYQDDFERESESKSLKRKDRENSIDESTSAKNDFETFARYMEYKERKNKKRTLRVVKVFAIAILAFVFFTNLGSIMNGVSNVRKSAPRIFSKVVEREKIDLAPLVLQAIDTAHDKAYNYASNELDSWINEMMGRVDGGFLDEYFSFLNVKGREIEGLFHAVKHKIVGGKSADEVFAEKLEDQISRKIIIPNVAQMRIENITQNAVDVYLSTLDKELAKLQEKYKIPTPDWNRYISDLCGIALDVDTKSTPIAMKTAVVSGLGILGLTAPFIKQVFKNVSEKIIAKTGGKIIAKAGAKTIAKVGAKAGAQVAGKAAAAIPVVGFGIAAATLVWDIVDYSKTSKEGKKQLRENFNSYFVQVKSELLGSTEGSIMGSINDWENRLKRNIEKNR